MGKLLGILLLGSSMLAAVWAQQSGWTLSAVDARPAARSEPRAWPGDPRGGVHTGTRMTFPAASAAMNIAPAITSRRVPGDIDGDGRSDLLLDNASLGQTAFWRMDGTRPVAYSPPFTKPDGYAQVASGDFNGDGRLDIVWARSSDRSLLMWIGDGIGFSQLPVRNYAEGWMVTGAGDINGDGRADLLLGNATQGLFAYWLMDGAVPTVYSAVFAPPSAHAQAATGDFNGDGKLDIVWSRASDRTLVMWIGDGTGFQQLSVGAYSAGWEISGAGDVDGDGRSDLLLFNKTRYYNYGSGGQQLLAYWIMSGATPVRYSPPFFVPGGTVPATVGDYNGDGKLDVVLVDERRTLYVALGDGYKLLPDYLIDAHSILATGWQVVRGFGAAGYRIRPSYVRGDADGDGKSDLLLVGVNNGPAGPSAPGKLMTYLMDGPVIREMSAPVDLGCAASKALATGDFNADGVLDLVFERNCGTRETVMRFSAGRASFVDALLPNPAAGWSIIGARRASTIRSDLLLGQNVTPSGEMDALAYWTMDGSKITYYSAGFLAPAQHRRLLSKNFVEGNSVSLVWGGTAADGRQTLMKWEAISTGFVAQLLQSPAAGWAVFGAGDIDGDGYAELLLSKTSGTPGLAYWVMVGGGGVPVRYSPGFLPPPNTYGAERIATGDFNADGNLDLVFAAAEPCGLRSCPDKLVMWIGDGNGFRSYDVGKVDPAYSMLDP